MSYRQIGPADGSYQACKTAAATPGRFMCNAVNHSQKEGCPNPACWLHRPGAPDRDVLELPRAELLRGPRG